MTRGLRKTKNLEKLRRLHYSCHGEIENDLSKRGCRRELQLKTPSLLLQTGKKKGPHRARMPELSVQETEGMKPMEGKQGRTWLMEPSIGATSQKLENQMTWPTSRKNSIEKTREEKNHQLSGGGRDRVVKETNEEYFSPRFGKGDLEKKESARLQKKGKTRRR